MSKNKILVSVIVIIIVLAAGAWLIFNPSSQQKTDTEKQMEVAAGMIKEKGPLPGGDIINEEQIVVSSEGEPVKIDVMPNSPEAPKAVVVDKKKLPTEAVKIEVGDGKFTPENFTVKANAPVSLAFISTDKKVHVITFSDASLAALAFGVPAGQTKAMTFNAPSEPGVYDFHCDVPGHRAEGELGTMTVE